MPEGKVFLDTNILIYAHDRSAATKHEIARDTVLDLWNHGQGLLSTQVLQEFFFSITRKIPHPIDVRVGRKIVEDLFEVGAMGSGLAMPHQEGLPSSAFFTARLTVL